ncbi:MAG: hypothetical protein KDC90_14370 [Ignavibacteriae bacterium]|nr:hypothetical protein [Ignavibacteriota bacterium]
MSTISRWILPCYYTDSEHSTEPIKIDLTKHLIHILSNEVWNRKFEYGFTGGLKNTDINDIKRACVIVFPRFISGVVDGNRIPKLIEKHCGILPEYLKISNYKNWSYNIGFSIIEVEYKNPIKNIPVKKDFNGYMPNYNEEFLNTYHRHFAVLKELKFFFLAGLHLSFPTTSITIRDDNPISDGFFQISSGKRKYATLKASSSFMHEVLFQKNKLNNLITNLNGLATKWHFNLWPIKRYLIAVESYQISMDNLLDLIYSLEGLFSKNTSTDFIKMYCILTLANNKKEAKTVKEILDIGFRMRNDIAHGERSYDLFDKIKIGGKEKLAQHIYWKIKVIVAQMIIFATSKLLDNPDMRNLKFNDDDFLNLIYSNN